MNLSIKMSQENDKVSAALVKAQGEIKNALRDKPNEFFNAKYADLAAIRDIIREPFSKNGLAAVQSPHVDENGSVCVDTMVLHSSGQWLECGTLRMKLSKNTPQQVGTCITYACRYQLAPIAGIAQEDDDGNTSSGNDPAARQNQKGKDAEEFFGKTPAEQAIDRINACKTFSTLIPAAKDAKKHPETWVIVDAKAHNLCRPQIEKCKDKLELAKVEQAVDKHKDILSANCYDSISALIRAKGSEIENGQSA